MKKSIVLSALPLLVVSILGTYISCGSNGGGNPVSAGNGTTTVNMPGTFRATADTIYLTMQASLDTFKYCNQDSMVVQIDTISSQGETPVPYTISGNTLTSSSLTSKYMNDSGSWVIVQNTVFNRKGNGNGLQGTWALSSETYLVISGVVPDSTRHMLDSTVAATNQSLSAGEFAAQLTFSGDQITETVTFKNASTPADYFVSSWDNCTTYGMDTCAYAISVTKLNDYTVQLHGAKSNETVTIVWNAAGDMTYTSSDTSHHASVYYEKPTSCPDPYEPSWYFPFLTANSKTTITLVKRNSQPIPAKRHAPPVWGIGKGL